METVSIIIPVHNAAPYIEDTLRSVKAQNYKPIEIIVVNGDSTDNSVALIEALGLKNLTIYNRANLGQASNSNYGITKAKGSLIKFLDADDILSEDCIEKMVLKWRENTNRLVFGEWHYFVNSKENVSWNQSPVYKDYDNALDFYVDVNQRAGSMLAAWMWLIPKRLIQKAGGWDERLTITNDLEFSTRLILQSDGISFAKGAKHFYRKGVASAMTAYMSVNLPEATAISVFTGLNKSCNAILQVEDSPRIRLIFANLYQKWVYMFYPKHKDLVEKFEETIKELGGSNRKPQGGTLFTTLNKFLSWKVVTRIQILLYDTIWKPVLVRKRKSKLKKQFGID